jgi:hypothetical protein
MLTIQNIDKFTTMLCNGKLAHKVEISPNGEWYIFYFRVSDFTPKVQKAYGLHRNDVEVCLSRTPNEEFVYRIFIMGYALVVEKLVKWDELQRPHLLATIVAKLLDKLQRVC